MPTRTILSVLVPPACPIGSPTVRTASRWTWGSTSGVDIDRDGKSVWLFDRCETADDCSNSKLDPVLKFDASGKLVKSFGAGMINYPHGLYVDAQDNIWVSDGRAKNNGKGHTVMKFSPEGKLLMTLGTPGVPGNAVFSAHETWQHMQGPFFYLRYTRPGDEITLQLADGRQLVYRVTSNLRFRLLANGSLLIPIRRLLFSEQNQVLKVDLFQMQASHCLSSQR